MKISRPERRVYFVITNLLHSLLLSKILDVISFIDVAAIHGIAARTCSNLSLYYFSGKYYLNVMLVIKIVSAGVIDEFQHHYTH